MTTFDRWPAIAAGGIWIGTYGGGLNRYDPRQEQFIHYRHDPMDANSLSAPLVWSILEDDLGNLWFGTEGGGLNHLDRATGQWRVYRHDSDDPASIASDIVLTMHQDPDGIIWLGTRGAGIDRFDPATEQFTHLPADRTKPDSLRSNTVWQIQDAGDDNLWVGTTAGLSLMDRDGTVVAHYANDPADPASLSYDVVWPVLPDSAGQVWVGTQNGLNRLDPSTGQFTRYLADAEDPASISDNIVLGIHEQSDGTIWFGTWGGGLNRFGPATETFHAYRVRDGLPNDTVYAIQEDRDGNFWLSTNKGLSRFDPETGRFRNYTARDGLQSNEFNLNAHFQSESGELFFGGINGVTAFYPHHLRDNAFPPPVAVTSLTSNWEEIPLPAAVEELEKLTLRWPDNSFEFGFAALNFSQPENNQYAYMLEGFDDDWNVVGSNRVGRYTNLPGGSYTLRIKAANNDGLWNEEGASLAVTIVPPFWATWWFRGLVALFFVAAVAGAVRLRTRSTEAKARELEVQVAERTAENVRLVEDTQRRVAQLTALQETTRAVASTLDQESLLNLIIQQATTLLSGEGGLLNLVRWETGEDEVVAGCGSMAFAIGERAPLEQSLSGWATLNREAVVSNDLQNDSRVHRKALAWVDQRHVRNAAVAPMSVSDRIIGTLVVANKAGEQSAFNQSDLDLLQPFADQAATAIRNAQLYAAEQRRADQFRVIGEVSGQITTIMPVEEILTRVAELVHETFDYYHVGIGLVEGDEVVYRTGAGQLWDSLDFEFKPARLRLGEEGLTGWVAASGQSVNVPDVRLDPRYVKMLGTAALSELIVPITVKSQVIGVLDVQSRRTSAFDETDLSVLQALAHQMGAAIENTLLYEQAQQAAVVEERSRLARELHDAVTQTLFSASLLAEVLPATWETDQTKGRELLGELRQLSRGALAEMRTLLLELRPSVLADSDLGDLLRQLAEAVTGRTGMLVQVIVEIETELPVDVRIALYRIAQEALNNIVKHARARQRLGQPGLRRGRRSHQRRSHGRSPGSYG